MIQKSVGRISEGKLVLLALVGGIAAFAIALVLISGGAVRTAQIFLPEKSQLTVAFRNVEGEVKLVGLEGTAEVNQTILKGTGDFARELTVIN